MEDSEKGSDSNPAAEDTSANGRSGFVGYIKRQLHGRKAKQEKENPLDRAARITAKATVWIAFFTVVMALVGVGTLYEIIDGGKDTRALAVAAGKQADSAELQLTEMKKQATDTHELAAQAKNQADRTKDLADRALLQANATAKIAKLTQDSLNVSQQAYVTVGRADGTVAEILMPPDSETKAAILVYFQNTGHMPAKFNWGNNSPIIAVLPSDPKAVKEPYGGQGFSEFDTENIFRPMYRARRRDQVNGFTWSGTTTIAGNSSYEGVLWEIPKERMSQLMNLDRPFMPSGKFQYCDGFGHQVCRKFSLRYAGNPYNKLFLASEEECAVWEAQVLNPDHNFEYLNPCEVQERREELKGALKGSPKP